MNRNVNWKKIANYSKSFTQKTWIELKKNWKYFVWGLLGILGIHLIMIVAIILAVNKGMFGPLPDKNQLKNIENPLTAVVYTSDSVMMGRYYLQNRMDLDRNEITSELKNALIATEDKRFYNHNGIDVKSLFRVLVKTLMLQKENSGGGSTITQQLAKNLYPRKDYRFGSIVINKLREMVIAVKLEKLYSKEQILLLYLNTVPFGEDSYGIKTGALRFFYKHPRQLNTEEIAMMVGMLKGTSLYNPRINYERSLDRRNTVLLQMRRYGMMTKAEEDSISDLPIELDYYRPPVYSGVAPYFRNQVIPRLENILENINKETGSDYNLYTDGLKIYTTIDSRLQHFAETAIKENLPDLQNLLNKQWAGTNLKNQPAISKIINDKLGNLNNDSINTEVPTTVFDWKLGAKDTLLSPVEKMMYNMTLLQSGFVVMDVHTGDIKVWIGGNNHEFFKYDHATALRQVGSTFKPFVYLTALEEGFVPCQFFNNRHLTYSQYEDWNPGNADGQYEGIYSLSGALTHSVNTVSAKLIDEVGISKVIRLTHSAGIRTELPEVASLALGTAELSLFEMVQGYQTIANKGANIEPGFISKIEDVNGKIIYEDSDKSRQNGELDASKLNIEILTAMLKNVVNKGTAARLRYKYNLYTDIAGKTGTTQNYADGWFIGFTPDLVAGVWVGAEYPAFHFRDRNGQGAYTAMPVWASFFSKLYNDKHYKHLEKSRFELRDSISKILDCEDYVKPPKLEQLDNQSAKKIISTSITTQ